MPSGTCERSLPFALNMGAICGCATCPNANERAGRRCGIEYTTRLKRSASAVRGDTLAAPVHFTYA
eukprot:7342807-Alexandrium_andersonii.AAC.1